MSSHPDAPLNSTNSVDECGHDVGCASWEYQITLGLEDIALRLEAIASRLVAIAIRLELVGGHRS